MSGESQSLIEQACSGDRPALERLLISHTDQLRIHLARGLPARLQSTVAVEDVVQEALTQSFLRIERLRNSSPEAFATWLKTIGDMTLVDFIRKEDAQKRGGQFRRRQLTSDSVTGSLVDLIEKLPGEAVTASRAMARQEGIAAGSSAGKHGLSRKSSLAPYFRRMELCWLPAAGMEALGCGIKPAKIKRSERSRERSLDCSIFARRKDFST